MKIAFDIGGLISRYPDQMKSLIHDLTYDGANQIYIVTDMSPFDAWNACVENGLHDLVLQENVLSADWSKYGDLCKTIVMEENGIDILLDDRPDYCARGKFIGLVLSPRPEIPYYHPTWKNRSTPAVMVPPEEFEAFQAWKAEREGQPK